MNLNSVEKYKLMAKRSGLSVRQFDEYYNDTVYRRVGVPKWIQDYEFTDITKGEVAWILRQRACQSLRDISAALNVSHQTLSFWERGVKGQADTMIKFLLVFAFEAERRFIKESFGITMDKETTWRAWSSCSQTGHCFPAKTFNSREKAKAYVVGKLKDTDKWGYIRESHSQVETMVWADSSEM